MPDQAVTENARSTGAGVLLLGFVTGFAIAILLLFSQENGDALKPDPWTPSPDQNRAQAQPAEQRDPAQAPESEAR